jgi:chitinase
MISRFAKALIGLYAVCFLVGTAWGGPIVAGFYPYQKFYILSPEKIKLENLTHLVYCFAWPRIDGTIATVDGSYHNQAFINRVHSAGKKFIVMMGGGDQEQSGPFSALVASAPARAEFVRQLTSWFDQYGYDGINIDWEYPQTAADKENLTLLLKELRAAFDKYPKPKELDLVCHGSLWYSTWVDYAAILSSVDYFYYMAYDFSGNWPYSLHAGHNAPLFDQPDTLAARYGNVNRFLSNLTDSLRLPASKIVLGVPFYGRVFYNAALWESPREGGAAETYSKIVTEYIQTNGYERIWDDQCKVPYLKKNSGAQIVSYDDSVSIRLKCEYIISKKLAGGFIWEITQDYFKDTDRAPLLEVMGDALIRNPSPIASGPRLAKVKQPSNAKGANERYDISGKKRILKSRKKTIPPTLLLPRQ